jgi:hypothetical protein
MSVAQEVATPPSNNRSNTIRLNDRYIEHERTREDGNLLLLYSIQGTLSSMDTPESRAIDDATSIPPGAISQATP